LDCKIFFLDIETRIDDAGFFVFFSLPSFALVQKKQKIKARFSFP